MNQDEADIRSRLIKEGYSEMNQILYASLDEKGNLYVSSYNEEDSITAFVG